MKIINSGKKVSKQDILLIEKELQVSFPEDYKEFLLIHNGGEPADEIGLSFLETDYETNEQFEQEIDIQSFSMLEELPEFYENLIGEVLPEDAGYISIACDSCGNDILLCVDNTNFGRVYFGDHDMLDPETDYLGLSLIANSFTDFVNSLHPFEE